MSADNRIIVHRHTDDKFWVWEASASADYHSPPQYTGEWAHWVKCFDDHKSALDYAFGLEDCSYIEYGVQDGLEPSEIIRALRHENEDLKRYARGVSKTLGE